MTRRNLFALALLIVVMAFVKLGTSEAVSAWGAWIVIPGLAAVFLVARLIDRRDRRNL